MSNVQSTKKAPQIRFKGFSDDWTKKSYTETFDTSVSNNTLSRAELTTEKTSTQNVHYGDILIKYNSILDVKNEDIPYIPEDVKIDSKNLLKNGDIVFADTAEDETCGKATEINNIDNEKLVAGLHTFVARSKTKFEEQYLGYFINSPAYHNQLLPFMQGTKVTSISKTSIQKTYITYPDSNEQSKIRSLFSQIDSLIASTQKEHIKLVTLKKCMLQKMFPKTGSLVPDIRFKGFSGNWKYTTLQKAKTFFTDGNYGESYPKSTDMSDSINGIPFLTGGNLRDGELDLTGASYITQEKHSKLTTGHLLEDDIVLAVRGSLGALGYVKLQNENWNINSQLAILRTDKKLIKGSFLIQYLLSNNGQKELLSRQTGSALKQLPINSLKDVKIPIISLEEQQKIGSYFQNLDNLISKQAAELEKLKNIKKTLLSKMFV